MPRPAPALPHTLKVPRQYAAANATRLTASIEYPLRDRARDDDEGEQAGREDAEQGHEATAIDRTAAVGRGARRRPHQRTPRDDASSDHENKCQAADQLEDHGLLHPTAPMNQRIADHQVRSPGDGSGQNAGPQYGRAWRRDLYI